MSWKFVEKHELYGKGDWLKQHISNNLKLLPLE